MKKLLLTLAALVCSVLGFNGYAQELSMTPSGSVNLQDDGLTVRFTPPADAVGTVYIGGEVSATLNDAALAATDFTKAGDVTGMTLTFSADLFTDGASTLSISLPVGVFNFAGGGQSAAKTYALTVNKSGNALANKVHLYAVSAAVDVTPQPVFEKPFNDSAVATGAKSPFVGSHSFGPMTVEFTDGSATPELLSLGADGKMHVTVGEGYAVTGLEIWPGNSTGLDNVASSWKVYKDAACEKEVATFSAEGGRAVCVDFKEPALPAEFWAKSGNAAVSNIVLSYAQGVEIPDYEDEQGGEEPGGTVAGTLVIKGSSISLADYPDPTYTKDVPAEVLDGVISPEGSPVTVSVSGAGTNASSATLIKCGTGYMHFEAAPGTTVKKVKVFGIGRNVNNNYVWYSDDVFTAQIASITGATGTSNSLFEANNATDFPAEFWMKTGNKNCAAIIVEYETGGAVIEPEILPAPFYFEYDGQKAEETLEVEYSPMAEGPRVAGIPAELQGKVELTIGNDEVLSESAGLSTKIAAVGTTILTASAKGYEDVTLEVTVKPAALAAPTLQLHVTDDEDNRAVWVTYKEGLAVRGMQVRASHPLATSIRYTIDGNDPTTDSPAIGNLTLDTPGDFTLKLLPIAEGFANTVFEYPIHVYSWVELEDASEFKQESPFLFVSPLKDYAMNNIDNVDRGQVGASPVKLINNDKAIEHSNSFAVCYLNDNKVVRYTNSQYIYLWANDVNYYGTPFPEVHWRATAEASSFDLNNLSIKVNNRSFLYGLDSSSPCFNIDPTYFSNTVPVKLFVAGDAPEEVPEYYWSSNVDVAESIEAVEEGEKFTVSFSVEGFDAAERGEVAPVITFNNVAVSADKYTVSETYPYEISVDYSVFAGLPGPLKIELPEGFAKIGKWGTMAGEFTYTFKGLDIYKGRVGAWMFNGKPVTEVTIDIDDQEILPVFQVNPDFKIYMNNKRPYFPYFRAQTSDDRVVGVTDNRWDYTVDVTIIKKGVAEVTVDDQGDETGYTPAILKFNIVGVEKLETPDLTLSLGNSSVEYVKGKTLPVSAGMKLVLTEESEDAQIHYTLDGTEVTADSPVYTTPIEITSAMEGTTLQLKAMATLEGAAPSSVLDVEIPVGGWYLVENTTAFDNGSFFIVTGDSGSQTYTFDNTPRKDSFFQSYYNNIMARQLSTICNGRKVEFEDGVLIMEKTAQSLANAYNLNPAVSLASSWMTSYNQYGVYIDEDYGSNYAGLNRTASGSGYDWNSMSYQLDQNTLKFNPTAKQFVYNGANNVRMYVWSATDPRPASSYTLSPNLVGLVTPGTDYAAKYAKDAVGLTVTAPYGYTVSYTINGATVASPTFTTVGEYDVTVTGSCPQFPTINWNAKFTVSDYGYTYTVEHLAEDGYTVVDSEPISRDSYNEFVLGYRDRLKVTAEDDVTLQWLKGSVDLNDDKNNKWMTSTDGHTAYFVGPRKNNATAQFVVRQVTVTETKFGIETINIRVLDDNVSETDASKNTIDFREHVMSFAGEACSQDELSWLTGGGRPVAHDHSDYTEDNLQLFIPRYNQVAYVDYGEEYGNAKALWMNENTVIRIALGKEGRRITSLEVSGNNLKELAVGKVTHSGNIISDKGLFTELNGTVQAGVNAFKWTFDPNEFVDIQDIEIWHKPIRVNGVRAKAGETASNPAVLYSVGLGTDISTGISFSAEDVNADATYYDVNGLRVDADNLVPGVYVRVQGGKAEKVVVK